jgi:hypothetical protein
MKLEEIIEEFALSIEPPPSNPEISSVVSDSRRVEPGSLFVAIAGRRRTACASRRGPWNEARRRSPPAACGRFRCRGCASRIPAAGIRREPSGPPAAAMYRQLRIAGVTRHERQDDHRDAPGRNLPPRLGAQRVSRHGRLRMEREDARRRTTPRGDVLAAMMRHGRRRGSRLRDGGLTRTRSRSSAGGGNPLRRRGFTNPTRDHLDFHGTLEVMAAEERLSACANRARRHRQPRRPVGPSDARLGCALLPTRPQAILRPITGPRKSGHALRHAPARRRPSPGRRRSAARRALQRETCSPRGPRPTPWRSIPKRSRPSSAENARAPGRMERWRPANNTNSGGLRAHGGRPAAAAFEARRSGQDDHSVFGCGGDPATGQGTDGPRRGGARRHPDRDVRQSRGEDPRRSSRKSSAADRAAAPRIRSSSTGARRSPGRSELASSRSVVCRGKGTETTQVSRPRVPFDDLRRRGGMRPGGAPGVAVRESARKPRRLEDRTARGSGSTASRWTRGRGVRKPLRGASGAPDGHDFVAEARRGVAALVPPRGRSFGFPLFVVADSLVALQGARRPEARGGGGFRRGGPGRWGRRPPGVAAIVSGRMRAGKDPGNANSGIGFPMAILGLPAGLEAVCGEFGIEHSGRDRDPHPAVPAGSRGDHQRLRRARWKTSVDRRDRRREVGDHAGHSGGRLARLQRGRRAPGLARPPLPGGGISSAPTART